MTEIKIPFTKTKIEKQGNQPQNSVKWIDLEINTNFLMSQIEPRLDLLHGGSPDGPLARMRLVFFDNAEPALYQDLLNKNNFELTFDLAKVAYEVGGGMGVIDNTKPTVCLYQAPSSRMLEVYFKPQFAGVIKLTESNQPTPPVPNPQPDPQTPEPTPNSASIQFTKKSAKKADLSELRKGDKEAEGIELEVESFTLNTERHGQKTFEKIVFIDNQNKNSDKLAFLLDPANKNLEVKFLNNAKIDKWEGHEGGLTSEQPNVTWRTGHEKELNIYLNDVFGFKPNEISVSQVGQKQDNPQNNDDNRERERERERDKNGPEPTQLEITNLKNELEQVKGDIEKLKKFIARVEKKKKDSRKGNSDLENILKKSKNRLKDLEKKQTSSDKGFWRKEVVIPVILLLILVVFIGIFFWVRKKRK